MSKLIVILLVTVLITIIETVSYAARLSGARTKRVGTAMSLFNILVVISRSAVMLQSLLISSMLDNAIKGMELIRRNYPNQDVTQLLGDLINQIELSFRMVLLSISLGIILGLLFMPSVARVIDKGTYKLTHYNSVISIVRSEGLFRLLLKIPSQFWLPSFKENIKQYKRANLPFISFWLNALIFLFYSISILSSLLAGALIPEYRMVAGSLATVINGFGTILLVVLVDPVVSSLLDNVVAEKRPVQDLKALLFQLGLGRLLGTLCAQLFLVPFALLIKWAVIFIEGNIL